MHGVLLYTGSEARTSAASARFEGEDAEDGRRRFLLVGSFTPEITAGLTWEGEDAVWLVSWLARSAAGAVPTGMVNGATPFDISPLKIGLARRLFSRVQPSQCGNPCQPIVAYVLSGVEGMSAGRSLLLLHSFHSFSVLSLSERANSSAFLKGRAFWCRVEILPVPESRVFLFFFCGPSMSMFHHCK